MDLNSQVHSASIAESVVSIFEAANVPVVFDRIDNFSFEDTKARELLKKNSCILLGVMVPERGVKAKYNDNHKFYKYLDLYANVNLCFSIPSIKSRHSNVDIAVIRENTEGSGRVIQVNSLELSMKYTRV